MANLTNWILASRPKTLTVSVSPVLIGGAMAYGDKLFYLPAFLAALFGALCIQIGTNFANDYFDFKKGADTKDRLGPKRVMQAGLISEKSMRFGIIFIFFLAICFGVFLVARAGWPIILIGLSGILFGVCYTYGRYALAYTGLADIITLIYFGPIAVAGTYYVQALEVSWLCVLAGLAPGFLSVALISINNLRDREEDLKSNKKTLSVRFGAKFSKLEFGLSILVAGLIPIILFYFTKAHSSSLLASVVILTAYRLPIIVWENENPAELNNVLAAVGKLTLVYGCIFSVGWLI